MPSVLSAVKCATILILEIARSYERYRSRGGDVRYSIFKNRDFAAPVHRIVRPIPRRPIPRRRIPRRPRTHRISRIGSLSIRLPGTRQPQRGTAIQKTGR